MNETRDLYLLSDDYRRLFDYVVESSDEETGEVDIALIDALGVAQEQFEKAAVGVATIYRILGDESERFEAEIKRLTEIKKRIDRKREAVKQAISDACERTGVSSVRGMYANISFRRSEQTVIDNVWEIPDEYMTEKIERFPNKAKIKDAIREGKTVPGASLKTVRNIQIK